MGDNTSCLKSLDLERGSRKFCQRVSKFNNVFFFFFFFLVDEGIEDPSTALIGPSSVRQRNAVKWRFAGVPMIAHHGMLAWQLCDFKRIQTSISKKPYIFVIFQGGGVGFGPPVPTSGSAHG